MNNFRFTFKLKNSPLDKLLDFVVSRSNDLYLFPPLTRGSPMANSGLHISYHASGESQVTVQEFHISCLGFKPKIRLPFSREEFTADVIAKKPSLFSEINLTAEQKAGTILVLKSEVVTDFINTTFKNWLEDARYIDYYKLSKNQSLSSNLRFQRIISI